MKTLIAALLLFAATSLYGEELTISLYQTIEETAEKNEWNRELILRLNNPTERTYFTFGHNITDITRQVEVFRNGKWEVIPPHPCGTGKIMRKLLPHSNIIFTTWIAPRNKIDLKYRVRVWVFTDEARYNADKEPNRKPYIELLSPEFSDGDFRAPRTSAPKQTNPHPPSN